MTLPSFFIFRNTQELTECCSVVHKYITRSANKIRLHDIELPKKELN